MSNTYPALKLKDEGNVYFKKGEYEKAESYYSQALQKDATLAQIWTNRANARLKLENWHGALDDCLKSIELKPKDNLKGFYFLGTVASS